MTKYPQLSRSRDRISRYSKFGFALALAGLFVVAAPQRANADASTGISKWLCPNSPGPNNTTCDWPGVTTPVQVGSAVYYVIKVQNPTPAPILVTLNDTYPSVNFVNSFVGGTVFCTINNSITNSYTGVPAISSMSTSISVPASDGISPGTLTCTILGVFTQAQAIAHNVVTDTDSGGTTTKDHQLNVIKTDPLNADLSITKKVSPQYPQNLDVSAGPQTVHYTITIKNNGPAEITIGPFFTLHDTFELMPNSVPLDVKLLSNQVCNHYNASGGLILNDCLTTPVNQIPSGLAIDPHMVMTANWQEFASWNFGSDPGHMMPGDYIVLTYDVAISRVPWITCVKAPDSDGLLNNAYFDLARLSGTTLTELNPSNNISNTNPPGNTDSNVSVYTGYYIADPACAASVGMPPLQITKVQIFPPVPPVPWGALLGVIYRVTIHNSSTQAIPNITFDDSIQEGLGTPPFTGSISGCLFPGCPGTPAPPYHHHYYTDTNVAWGPGTDPTPLPGGATRTYFIRAHYTDPSCTTVPVITSEQIINIARIIYTVPPLNGVPSSTFVQQASYTTVMKQQPTCPFVVTKKVITPGLKVYFNVPTAYTVTYQNQDTVVQRVVGTLIDAVRITKPNYATALSYDASFTCHSAGGVSGFRPAGVVINGSVIYTTSPAQGARIIDNGIGGGPVTFPPGAKLTCTVFIVVHPPATTNPYCFSSIPPAADLENLALMDVSTIYNPNLPWPPSGAYGGGASNPAPQDRNWATVRTSLPQCYNFTLNKFASNPGNSPPAWTSAPNVVPPVNYAIIATNTGMTGIPALGGIYISDTPPSSGTLVPPVNSPVAILPPGVSYTEYTNLVGPITSANNVDNCAELQATGVLAGPDWYAAWAPGVQPPAPVLKSCAQVPVIPTTTVNVTKTVVNGTGSTIPILMPLTFNVQVVCGPYQLYPSNPTLTLPVGPGTLVNNGSINSLPGQIQNVPVSNNLLDPEHCTVTETGPLPQVPQSAQVACSVPGTSTNNAYWDTTPTTQTISVTGPGPYAVTVTNTLRCTGSLTVKKVVVVAPPFAGSAPPGQPFLIHVQCVKTSPSSWNQTYDFDLAASGTQATHTINGIPIGSTCTISEDNPSSFANTLCDNFVWQPPAIYTPPNPIPINGPTQTVTVTNHYQCQGPPGTGSLTLIKTAAWRGTALSSYGPVTFPIQLDCTPPSGAPTSQIVNINATDNGSFQQTVTGLPDQSQCTINELPPVYTVANANSWAATIIDYGRCSWHKSYPLGQQVTIQQSTPQTLQIVNQQICHGDLGGITVQEVKTPIIGGVVNYTSGVPFPLNMTCNGSSGPLSFPWIAGAGSVLAPFSYFIQMPGGDNYNCTWEETPWPPPIPYGYPSTCQWQANFFYNGVDITVPPSQTQSVPITMPQDTSPGYPYNWLDVQNKLICPGDPPVNIYPVIERIIAPGGSQVGPTPLHCDPPMVPDMKQAVCKCPDGTEFKNGKCVKKKSALGNILGHVSIGVGVGVSSSGGETSEKPPRQ